MKHLLIVLEDHEFKELQKLKTRLQSKSWRSFILDLAFFYEETNPNNGKPKQTKT